jgi:hypothetical protein
VYLRFTATYSVQLLFIDGRVSSSIIPMMLPRFSGRGLYMSFMYPVLFALLQVMEHSTFAYTPGGLFPRSSIATMLISRRSMVLETPCSCLYCSG